MPQYVFSATRNFHDQNTDMVQFAAASAGAVWNLRWQVAGYTAVSPNATKSELLGRFLDGSGIRGLDLRRTCITTRWDDQLHEVAKLTLVNACAYYEGWAAELSQAFPSPKTRTKQLQFPDSPAIGSKPSKPGAPSAVAAMTARHSSAMAASYGYLSKRPSFDPARLNSLLLVFRLFKEARNSYVHGNGLASQALLDAASAVAPLKPTDIGMKVVPQHMSPVLGSPYRVTYNGVMGFCGVVLRIVGTVDSALAATEEAAHEVVAAWRAAYGKRWESTKPVRRETNVRTLVGSLGIAFPYPPSGVVALLEGAGLLV